MREINDGVIEEFRANEGRLSGPMAGAPILLLTTTGRRTGATHTTPVGFVDIGGGLAIAAANGGAADHPDWFLNIEHAGEVTIEVPGATIPSVAAVADEPLRTELLEQLAARLPGMAEHVANSGREIPVVVLTADR